MNKYFHSNETQIDVKDCDKNLMIVCKNQMIYLSLIRINDLNVKSVEYYVT